MALIPFLKFILPFIPKSPLTNFLVKLGQRNPKVQHIQFRDPLDISDCEYDSDYLRKKDCTFADFYRRTRLEIDEQQQLGRSSRTKSKRSIVEFENEMGYFSKPPDNYLCTNSPQELMDTADKLRKIKDTALTSRIIVLLIQIFSGLLIPKHENDGFKTPKDNLGTDGTFVDSFVNSTLSGFLNWDGEYFLHITTNGYTHENTIAFFPLFPATIALFTKIFYLVLFPIISYQSIAQIIGWSFNTLCFIESAISLAKLTSYCDRGLYNLDSIVLYLFCFNPASIFFSSFYSESLFAYLTINVLLALYERKFVKSVIYASLSSVCRSNGLLNFGFIGAFLAKHLLIIEEAKWHNIRQKLEILYRLGWNLLYCALGLIPFTLFQIYCSWEMCRNMQPVESSKDICNFSGLPYMYVQAKNWNVGFLRYFEFAQIPNFILASPVLLVLGYESFKRACFYGRCVTKYKFFTTLVDLAMGVHGLFLTFFCLFCMHVQVSTRLIMSACPYLYIYIAKSLRTELCRVRSREISWLPYTNIIHTWFAAYFLLGTLLFSRGYPWT